MANTFFRGMTHVKEVKESIIKKKSTAFGFGGNVRFSQSEASLVATVPVDWLKTSSWGPGLPSASFCLALAQDVCDGQRLQLITLQRPGLTPSVCLSRKAFAFWMPAFCKLIRVCKCVCVHRRMHRFAASPHELWLTAVSMSEVRARLAMLSFTVTGTSLVCVQPAGSGFGRARDASANTVSKKQTCAIFHFEEIRTK